MTPRVVTPGNDLRERAGIALADAELQRALRNLDQRLFTAREVQDHSPELKDRVAEVRREVLGDLDGWLAAAQGQLESVGAVVHRCVTAAEARDVILGIARREGVQRVVKSKSMATEEIALTDFLERAGLDVVETDLGEYIVQVAGERPSHMITPAIHKTIEQIAGVLSSVAAEELVAERESLTSWAREHLRRRFLEADMGITGANFVAADTGTVVLVTNEGNGRFCTTLPRVMVAVVPIEKVIARFADLGVLIPTLTMSATGQSLSNYVTMLTGPRRESEQDGPEQLHVVFLDNNRSDLIGTPYEEMLACIRCGACLNVCPVYRKVSGHAYDAVYSGPMGKVLTPLLSAGVDGRDLPHASTLCGACTEACPAQIPLADLLVRLRTDLREGTSPVVVSRRALESVPSPAVPASPQQARPHERLAGEGYFSAIADTRVGTLLQRRATRADLGFRVWGRLWASPAGYRSSSAVARVGARVVGRNGWASRVPGLAGWSRTRDVPIPSPRSFRQHWAAREAGRETW